ncbi:hypothetical protein QEN19_004107 [Hanseniaspora menglaensis]
MAVKDTYYYDILEISSDATSKEIRKAYKIQSIKTHPDKNRSNPEEAQLKFQLVSEAYQVLIDDKLRNKYDQVGREALKTDSTVKDFENASDVFATIFGSEQFDKYIGELNFLKNLEDTGGLINKEMDLQKLKDIVTIMEKIEQEHWEFTTVTQPKLLYLGQLIEYRLKVLNQFNDTINVVLKPALITNQDEFSTKYMDYLLQDVTSISKRDDVVVKLIKELVSRPEKPLKFSEKEILFLQILMVFNVKLQEVIDALTTNLKYYNEDLSVIGKYLNESLKIEEEGIISQELSDILKQEHTSLKNILKIFSKDINRESKKLVQNILVFYSHIDVVSSEIEPEFKEEKQTTSPKLQNSSKPINKEDSNGALTVIGGMKNLTIDKELSLVEQMQDKYTQLKAQLDEEHAKFTKEQKEKEAATVKELSKVLVEKLSLLTESVNDEACVESFKAKFKSEADELKMESFGIQLLHTIGKVYTSKAKIYMNSHDYWHVGGWSGILKEKFNVVKDCIEMVSVGLDAQAMQSEVERVKVLYENKDGDKLEENSDITIEKPPTEEELREMEQLMMGKALSAAWHASKWEIISKLKQVCDTVLYDETVSKDKQYSRAKAMYIVGKVFKSTERTRKEQEEVQIYEDLFMASSKKKAKDFKKKANQ